VSARGGVEWLFASQRFGIKLGLDNTRALLAALGSPDRGMRFIHVAGTNGKGSVCAMLDSILRASGHRTGLYTSPHLIDPRERVRVDGGIIPHAAFADLLERIRELTADWDHRPTFFEILTTLAIRHFADAGTGLVILETGMGGRLDATNAITPLVSAITPIDLDHTRWLGETIAKIAVEKAGILKPGVPGVSAPQRPEAEAALLERASRIGSTIRFISRPETRFPIALPGDHQRWNAALALAALEAAGLGISDETAARGLAGVHWPGRFQILAGGTVLDGAHNPHGIRALVAAWGSHFPGERAAIVFGALADKSCAEMIAALSPITAEFHISPVASERAESPGAIAALAPGQDCRVHPDLPTALAAAGSSGHRVLVTGSLFLVGEALALLDPR